MRGILGKLGRLGLVAKSPRSPDWERWIGRLQSLSRSFGNAPCLPGQCNVCGEATVFFCKATPLARESYLCAGCRSTSRYRAAARGVLRYFAEALGIRAASLRELRRHRLPRPVRVYDTQLPFYYLTCAYPLPDELAAVDGVEVQLSRFRPDAPLGSVLGAANITNQNLERLTFPDAHFDLVVTSDVMEHVRLDDLAHREIRRVLRPGGAYVFNVPHTRARRQTLHRVVVHDPEDPSRDEHVLEPEYHGDANDPGNRALAYRVYGTELDETLRRLGFEVDYRFFDHSDNAVVNTELFYCRLPADARR